MGSIGNPGFSNLGQILSRSGAWLVSAALLSPSAQTDLQSGAISDLVQLSDQALQFQAGASLYGAGAGSAEASLLSSFATPSYGLNTLTPSLDSSLLSSSNSLLDSLSANLTPSLNSFDSSQQTGLDTTPGASSFGSNIAAYEAQLQLANTQTLFGLDSSGNSASSVNLLA